MCNGQVGAAWMRVGKQWLYLNSLASSEAGPHSWVINRQIREVGSVAWIALTNLTAAASLGVMATGWLGKPGQAMRRNISNHCAQLHLQSPSPTCTLFLHCSHVKHCRMWVYWLTTAEIKLIIGHCWSKTKVHTLTSMPWAIDSTV